MTLPMFAGGEYAVLTMKLSNDMWVRIAAFSSLAVVAVVCVFVNLWFTGAIIVGTALALGEAAWKARR